MTRLFIGSAALLAASVAASAGQIEIGQYVGNSSAGATQGLTSNYITGATPCVGQVFQGNACIAANAANKAGWAEVNFNSSLFASATNGATAPTVYSGYNASSTTAGSSITNNGETFAMLNDTSGTQNTWYANMTTSIFTVPVGVLGVTDTYMMLNNKWGVAGAQDIDVYFNFGSTSNATSGLTTVEVELTNSNTLLGPTGGPNAASGQIMDATTCLSGGAGSAFSTCSQYDGGPILASSTPTTLVNGVPQATGVNVVTNTVFGPFAYNTISAGAMNYQGTTGNLQLDDLGFLFGSAYQNLYLVSIGVGENSATGAPSLASATSSDAILTAVTIDTAPEPSTWMLLLGGITAIGVGRLRRRN